MNERKSNTLKKATLLIRISVIRLFIDEKSVGSEGGEVVYSYIEERFAEEIW
jgi:hypothetical protein